MKSLPRNLKAEYDRLTQLYKDIDGYTHPHMNVSDVFGAYFILCDYFTDISAEQETETMLVGLRDINLLASAIGRQDTTFGGIAKYSQPIDICATLFYGLVKNHAFADGNKRTALLTLLYQLDCYSYCPIAATKDFEKLVIAVAASEMQKYYPKEWQKTRKCHGDEHIVRTIAFLLRKMTKRKDTSFHSDITAKELQTALRSHSIDCEPEGSKLKITSYKTTFMQKRVVKKTKSIAFCGWSRLIGAKTIRELLVDFELFDQHPNYQSFFDGADPRYMLIGKFEKPLRRLKDR